MTENDRLKFFCDVMLGKLCRWLRIMGYDSKIASDELSDRDILEEAKRENRVVLTRDKDLKKMKSFVDVFLLGSKDFESQIKDLFSHFSLNTYFPSDSRCSHCNSELKKIEKNRWECIGCGHEYWKGSHWKRIKDIQRKLNDL